MLRLPGDFTPGPEVLSAVPNTSFVSSFQSLMRAQRPAPSLHHQSSLQPFIPRSLKDSSMVLVRHDGVRRPLQPPYDGPYPVLESGDKVFKILKNGLPYTVSVDRLKPCNLPLTPPCSSIIPNRLPPPPHPSTPSSVPVRPSPAMTDPAPPLQCPRTGGNTPVGPRTDIYTPATPAGPILADHVLPPTEQSLLRRHSPRPTNLPLPAAAPDESSTVDLQSNTDFPPLGPPKFTMSGRQSKPRIRLNL